MTCYSASAASLCSMKVLHCAHLACPWLPNTLHLFTPYLLLCTYHCCQCYHGGYTMLWQHSGSLPDSWAAAGAFQSLSILILYGMPLSGTIPPSWGSSSMAFPSLTWLQLGLCSISGTLPTEWGSATAFQQLQQLTILNTNIQGVCNGQCHTLLYIVSAHSFG